MLIKTGSIRVSAQWDASAQAMEWSPADSAIRGIGQKKNRAPEGCAALSSTAH
jgi:hypothetical protein